MPTDTKPASMPQPLTADLRSRVEVALSRVLQESELQASGRLRDFLTYVMQETLEGRGERIKGFTVATAVYGRGADFDPQANSIVRVEATRLRRLLANYYAGPGAGDDVEIILPRGSYMPQFQFRDLPPAVAEQESAKEIVEDDVPAAPVVPPQAPAGRWSGRAVLGAVLLSALLASGLAAFTTTRVDRSVWDLLPVAGNAYRLPTLVTRLSGPDRGDPQSESPLQLFGAKLEDALSRFDDLSVVVGSTERTADYELAIRSVVNSGGRAAFTLRVIHARSGEILWSREVMGDHALQADVDQIASRIGQPYGIVFTDMRKRFEGLPPEQDPYQCVIKTFDFFMEPGWDVHDGARRCAEAAVAAFPSFASGFEALALLHAATYLQGFNARPGEDARDQAVMMGVRAAALAPRSARALGALFWVRFLDGRHEHAFALAQQALALNPNASDLMARVGAAHILRGHYEEGRVLLKRATDRIDVFPGWYGAFFFLDAFMQGDERAMSLWARRRSTTGSSPLGLVARAIAAHRAHHGDLVQALKQRLDSEYPVFAADPKAGFDRYQMLPEMRDRLLAELTQVGFIPTQ